MLNAIKRTNINSDQAITIIAKKEIAQKIKLMKKNNFAQYKVNVKELPSFFNRLNSFFRFGSAAQSEKDKCNFHHVTQKQGNEDFLFKSVGLLKDIVLYVYSYPNTVIEKYNTDVKKDAVSLDDDKYEVIDVKEDALSFEDEQCIFIDVKKNAVSLDDDKYEVIDVKYLIKTPEEVC